MYDPPVSTYMPEVDMGAYESAFRGGFTTCTYDGNGNGEIDIEDLLEILAAWGMTQGYPGALDGFCDGIITIQDLLALLAAWGPCGQSTAVPQCVDDCFAKFGYASSPELEACLEAVEYNENCN